MAKNHSLPLPPVLTITANPAIDLNLLVPDNESSDDFLRAREARRAAGGKGVNVSRVLAELGVASTAACLVGGPDAVVYLSLLEKAPFDVRPIQVEGATRTNVTLTIESDKSSPKRRKHAPLKVNQPGPHISARQWRAAEAQLRPLLAGRQWVVISGSLPPGAPVDAYARLTRAARRAGAKVALDCEGEPLRLALAACPDLVKPNREELTRTFGTVESVIMGHGRADLLRGAQHLRELGAACVVVSQGKGECLAVDTEGEWLARPPKIEVNSPMGAGDSLVAGLIAGLLQGLDLGEALRQGVACGAACATAPDTVLAELPAVRALLPRVKVTRI